MNDLATITGRSALTFERYLPGPIERVWSYLTDPKFLRTWFYDGSVDDYVGGAVRFAMGAEGRIATYEPPHVLEYTWNENDAPCGPIPNALVRWELTREGDRVRLKLTHSRVPENALISLGAGWHTLLQRLYACLLNSANLRQSMKRMLNRFQHTRNTFSRPVRNDNNGKARLPAAEPLKVARSACGRGRWRRNDHRNR